MEKLFNLFGKKNNNETSNKKIEITEQVYNNNLQFYTMLKLLIKCKLSDKQLILLQDLLIKNILIKDKVLLQKILLSNNAIAAEGTQKYEDLCMLINIQHLLFLNQQPQHKQTYIRYMDHILHNQYLFD